MCKHLQRGAYTSWTELCWSLKPLLCFFRDVACYHSGSTLTARLFPLRNRLSHAGRLMIHEWISSSPRYAPIFLLYSTARASLTCRIQSTGQKASKVQGSHRIRKSRRYSCDQHCWNGPNTGSFQNWLWQLSWSRRMYHEWMREILTKLLCLSKLFLPIYKGSESDKSIEQSVLLWIGWQRKLRYFPILSKSLLTRIQTIRNFRSKPRLLWSRHLATRTERSNRS